MKKTSLGMVAVLLFVLVWTFFAWRVGNRTLLPYPTDVLDALGRLLTTGQTYRILASSFYRLFSAIVIATLLGVGVGLLAGVLPDVDAFLKPLVTSLRTVPVASVIVVILILYGSRTSLYIITFLMLFPLLYEATRQGVLNIDPSLKEAYTMETQRVWLGAFKFYLPLTLPFIKTGLLQSLGLGFKVLVMAEFIAQSPVSIGRALYISRISLAYDDVFAWTIIIIALVLTLEILVQKLKQS